jgi:N-acetylglucosaminyldiphosphoundecaprenol N-acetyl-beta-D-mannosaminyltransferase
MIRETSSTEQSEHKINVVGINISVTSYGGVVSAVRSWVGQTSPFARYICVTSVHGIITARTNAELRQSLSTADIATPDGMPVVWAMRSFGVRGQQRVYGPTLMFHLCEALAADRLAIYLYGGKPEVLPILGDQLRKKIPGLMVAGAYSPPFRPLTTSEDEEVVRMIEESGAAVVFVGISTPKQEIWMLNHRHRFPGKVLVGVGAAFDFHAGSLRQAPPWMQGAGLEWLFRLLMEPARLWRRYLLTTPRFLPLWGAQKLRALAGTTAVFHLIHK